MEHYVGSVCKLQKSLHFTVDNIVYNGRIDFKTWKYTCITNAVSYR